jgi:hypothetical protein
MILQRGNLTANVTHFTDMTFGTGWSAVCWSIRSGLLSKSIATHNSTSSPSAFSRKRHSTGSTESHYHPSSHDADTTEILLLCYATGQYPISRSHVAAAAARLLLLGHPNLSFSLFVWLGHPVARFGELDSSFSIKSPSSLGLSTPCHCPLLLLPSSWLDLTPLKDDSAPSSGIRSSHHGRKPCTIIVVVGVS